MSASKLLSIAKSTAESCLVGDTTYSGTSSSSARSIGADQKLYQVVESALDTSLLHCQHTFRLEDLQVVCAPKTLSREFKRRLSTKSDSDTYFLFHGTTARNHDSIFDKGFLVDEEHFGDTDNGYIGKGVYLSPHIEYSASYIKETPGITRFGYKEPVQVGVTFNIIGCVTIVGTTARLYKKEMGMEIPRHLDSHWAWVDSGGNAVGDYAGHLAVEYAIREPENIYPRFRISLKRVTFELVWMDPNIANSENSGHVRRLKAMKGLFVYATSSASKALEALKRRKEGTTYRAMTAGSGGLEFVKQLRAAGIHCRVLVFCNSVDYHQTWARGYSNVQVTREVSEMMNFATWKT